jgi:transglutaminase-like putative cysteine protease
MQPQCFEVTYAAVFGEATPAGTITLYLPVPSESEAQTLEALSVEPQLGDGKLLKWQIKREAEYGNRFLEAQVQDVKLGSRLALHYTVTRRELANSLEMATREITTQPSARFLQPDRLVPLNGPVQSLAKETLGKQKNDLDTKLKAIYEKTVALMRYDKSGTGWGQGDVIWACDNKRGNCTDFHSVLIGIARTSGIPGKFEIGLQMPLDKEEGTISGYHCWAYLFHPQRGWVPMDASEGWKNDKKFKDYYLGRIGSDRIALSVGRDLRLGQRGAPLNYFVFPYAEAGENAVPMSVDVSFRKLSALP